MPITNSLAFLFTVVGEWWAEGKVISRGTFCVFLFSFFSFFFFIDYVALSFFGFGKSLCVLTTTTMGGYRYVDRDGVCAGRYRAVRSVEEYMSA